MEKSALEYCEGLIDHYKKKASHNKKESLRCFLAVMGCTLSAPIFILAGEGLYIGKVLPAALTAAASLATAWLQLRKPQGLWALYRTAERELEFERDQHHFNLAHYAKSEDKDRLLGEKVLDIYRRTHYSWTKLIPDVERLQELNLDQTGGVQGPEGEEGADKPEDGDAHKG